MRPSARTATKKKPTAAPSGKSTPVALELDDETRIPDVAAHGRIGVGRGWKHPRLVCRNSEKARRGYDSMKRHEYLDEPKVLREKVALVVGMWREARNALLYTGAGISTASGIPDYATLKSKQKTSILLSKSKSRGPGRPTVAHSVLKAVCDRGMVHRWVQQNHDGLPQKAGVPQSLMNEIHGAWFDPSSPVIPMAGSLRPDLYTDMERCSERSDLTVVLGTSLCGMGADCTATDVAQRANAGIDGALGMVIVGIQRTVQDEDAAVRIFAKCDDFALELARQMGIEVPDDNATQRIAVMQDNQVDADWAKGLAEACGAKKQKRTGRSSAPSSIFAVPYDEKGRRLPSWKLCVSPEADTKPTLLNLEVGAKVRIPLGEFVGDEGEVIGFDGDAWQIRFRHKKSVSKKTGRFEKTKTPTTVVRKLGKWWGASAVNGDTAMLPVVSVSQKTARMAAARAGVWQPRHPSGSGGVGALAATASSSSAAAAATAAVGGSSSGVAAATPAPPSSAAALGRAPSALLAEEVGVPRAAARTALSLSLEDAKARAAVKKLTADEKRSAAEAAKELLLSGLVSENATGMVELGGGARAVAVSERVGDKVTTHIEVLPNAPPPVAV